MTHSRHSLCVCVRSIPGDNRKTIEKDPQGIEITKLLEKDCVWIVPVKFVNWVSPDHVAACS